MPVLAASAAARAAFGKIKGMSGTRVSEARGALEGELFVLGLRERHGRDGIQQLRPLRLRTLLKLLM